MLCTLLANSLIVHTDENKLEHQQRVGFPVREGEFLFFGVHKDADTLQEILDPETFAGLVISDDAAVYANFTQAQKCWCTSASQRRSS